jgi:RNA-binding protein
MKKPLEIDSQQRAWLRRQAHPLSPVVSIGTAGMTDAVEKAVDEALAHHELIKIKFHELKEERKDVCAYLAENLSAAVVGVIGNVGILYRPAKDPERRRIRLPVAKKTAD